MARQSISKECQFKVRRRQVLSLYGEEYRRHGNSENSLPMIADIINIGACAPLTTFF
jgi:hypothetical protein